MCVYVWVKGVCHPTQTMITQAPYGLPSLGLYLLIPEDTCRQEGRGKEAEPPLSSSVSLWELEKDALPEHFPLLDPFGNRKTFYYHLLES